MLKQISSDNKKTVAKSLGLVAAVLVILVVATVPINLGNKKATLNAFLQRTQPVPRRSESDATHLDCIAHLTKQSQLLDATRLDIVEAFVPISADAVVAYSDEAGNLHKMAWKEAVSQRRQHLNLDVLKQAHKMTDRNAEGTFQVLYPDNTAVMADLNTCQLTALYEPTPRGDVDPRMASQFERKRAAGVDTANIEVEEDEPGALEDIAFGTAPPSTKRFPWTVRLGDPISGIGYCSGEIIGYYYVLTSKHCLKKKLDNGVQITAGAKTIGEKKNRQIRQSVVIWRHPDEDIALIKVHPRFKYNDYVNKVPRLMAYKDADMLVFASGYGATATDADKMSDEFKYATMYTKSDDWCENENKHFDEGKEVCCTGGSGNTCAGDSGGPLVYYRFEKYNLLGVNSWSKKNPGCSGKDDNVDEFESIPFLHDWVVDTMGADYGWSNVVVYRKKCKQARWEKQGTGFVKTKTRTVYCESPN